MLILVEHPEELEGLTKYFGLGILSDKILSVMYHSNFKKRIRYGKVNGKDLFVIESGYGRTQKLAVMDYRSIIDQFKYTDGTENLVFNVGCYSATLNYFNENPEMQPGEWVFTNKFQTCEGVAFQKRYVFNPDLFKKLLSIVNKVIDIKYVGTVATSYDDIPEDNTTTSKTAWVNHWKDLALVKMDQDGSEVADYTSAYSAPVCKMDGLDLYSLGYIREIFDPEHIVRDKAKVEQNIQDINNFINEVTKEF